MKSQKDIKKAVLELTRGNIFLIAADAEHLPAFLAKFKEKKFNVRITFHKDIESDYYYIEPDKTPALIHKLDKIKELLK